MSVLSDYWCSWWRSCCLQKWWRRALPRVWHYSCTRWKKPSLVISINRKMCYHFWSRRSFAATFIFVFQQVIGRCFFFFFKQLDCIGISSINAFIRQEFNNGDYLSVGGSIRWLPLSERILNFGCHFLRWTDRVFVHYDKELKDWPKTGFGELICS